MEAEIKKQSPHIGEVEVVSFDLKRNLINILGEDHYPFAEYLYHELAANAYDGDATEVRISEETTEPQGPARPAAYRITVSDNGNGMDIEGLREYFTVGESQKRGNPEGSEVLHRPFIGRLGVGKVSILKVARRWSITTERHLGLAQPQRLEVRVDIDRWIDGDVPAFAVQYVEPTGRHGTEIVLEDVQVRMRQDRILRHLQRLPLGEDFMIWRQGELIPPRKWFGQKRIPISKDVQWGSAEGDKGHVVGEIWLRPEAPDNKSRAFIKEPKLETDAIRRDPAGIEVRVDGDMIAREFFGHEAHGHSVNRIWGWVEVPWLPILGNRTDYQHDHPASSAFYEAVKEEYDKLYNSIRYQENQRKRQDLAQRLARESADHPEQQLEADPPGKGAPVELKDDPDQTAEPLANRYGEVINEILNAQPEFSPVVSTPAKPSRGRPAKNRVYPVRRSGQRAPFDQDRSGSDLAVVDVAGTPGSATQVISGSVLRTPRPDASIADLGEIKVTTGAGVRLRFVSLSAAEGPYRWDLDNPDDLTLDINTDHKFYIASTANSRPGGPLHRMLCSWLVSLALLERRDPSATPAALDYIESLGWELFEGWGRRRED